MVIDRYEMSGRAFAFKHRLTLRAKVDILHTGEQESLSRKAIAYPTLD